MVSMIRFSRFANFFLSLFLLSCAHSAPQKALLAMPTPEHFRAAGTGKLDILAQANDVQIKGANGLGTSLLMVAARRNQLASVDYLLARGAPANALDMHRQTVLHYALPSKNPSLNAALLNAGADPSVEDQFGVVPAVMWAEEGSYDSLLLALQNKDKWCCLVEIKAELQNILTAAKKRRKYIPPSLFLVLKELD